MNIREDFETYDALGLADLVRRKEVSAAELVEAVIERIERVNPELNFVSINAYEVGRELAAGDVPDGPFHGVPLLLKDIILNYQGVRTTNGVPYYKDYVADHDSVLVERMKAAGFLLVVRTNVPEGGVCIATEPDLFGATLNPWNTAHTPGGSSGGSAAAVAARVMPLAHGSDGGGSIRIPAANCGLVGLKPSRGRITYAPDYCDFWYGAAVEGCVSLTVRDTAAFCDVIHGSVPGDPYQMTKEASYLDEVGANPGRLKIGFSTTGPGAISVDPACVEAVENAVKLCAGLGHDVEEVAFDYDYELLDKSFMRMACVAGALAMQTGEPVVGRPPTEDDFNPVNWELAERGKAITGTEHALDVEMLRHIGRNIAGRYAAYDVVMTPTVPVPPQKIGYYDMNLSVDEYFERTTPHVGFTLPINVSGQPAISLPLHWSPEGLPVGVQFIGRYCGEGTLLRLAAQIEEAQPWIGRRPPITA